VVSATSGTGLSSSSSSRGEPAQREVIVAAAVQGEGQHRHVVDAARLDQRSDHAGRDAVEVRLQLLVERGRWLDLRGADVEADDGIDRPGLEVE
jgi:hypothetical protein